MGRRGETGGERRNRIRYEERQEGCPEGQGNKSNYVAVGLGKHREPLESSRDLGCEWLPGPNEDDISRNFQQ